MMNEYVFTETQKLEALAELHTAQDFWRYAATVMSSAQVFFGHGTVCAWDEAGALVTQALNIEHEHIERISSCRLTCSERRRVLDWLDKRVNQRLPLPYISGKAYFCHLEFIVDERVLIPRSPIAELIESGFAPWIGERSITRVLDLCTGSGCIGIAAQYAFPDAQIVLADISAEALAVAGSNLAKHGLAEKIVSIQSDGLSAVGPQQFDLIICNPPYVDAGDMVSLPAEYQHEPALALASGTDGLDFIRQLLRDAPNYLAPGGLLFCEVGNSYIQMMEQFDHLPLTWIAFERSDDGVFMISREELLQFHGS